MIPRKAGAHTIRAVAEITSRRLTRKIGIGTEELDKAVVLQHLYRLQRPIMPREVKISINVTTVLPVLREPANALVDRAFLDPKTRVSPQLQIEWVARTRNLMRPVSKSNLHNMQNDVRAVLHVVTKIMKIFSPALPAIWVRIHRHDMQLLPFRILHKFAVNIRMLEDHGISSRIRAEP